MSAAGTSGHDVTRPGGHHDIDVDKHVRTYILVFVSLMVLTLITVAVGYAGLPIKEAVVVALLIASIKGSLVACYFMHLISERKLIYWVLALTVFMFAGLLMIPWFTHSGGTNLHG